MFIFWSQTKLSSGYSKNKGIGLTVPILFEATVFVFGSKSERNNPGATDYAVGCTNVTLSPCGPATELENMFLLHNPRPAVFGINTQARFMFASLVKLLQLIALCFIWLEVLTRPTVCVLNSSLWGHSDKSFLTPSNQNMLGTCPLVWSLSVLAAIQALKTGRVPDTELKAPCYFTGSLHIMTVMQVLMVWCCAVLRLVYAELSGRSWRLSDGVLLSSRRVWEECRMHNV